MSRREWAAAGLRLALAAGSLAVVGCGEPEATVVPSGKSRDELEKDIDNPYGVERKSTIKVKPSKKAKPAP